MIIWFTGLPSSGKTTLAKDLHCKLEESSILLDGDVLREGLCSDLSFDKKDRIENIRRVRCLCKLLANNDITVIVCAITPYEKMRRKNRKLLGDKYFEVFVDTPITECIKRDVKGLYKKAIKGEINDMTGIDDVFEIPQKPDCIVETVGKSVKSCVNKIMEEMKKCDI